MSRFKLSIFSTFLVLMAVVPALAQPCLAPPPDPVAAGSLARPSALFPSAEHLYIHSGTHLQGIRAHVKWGALIHTPPVNGSNFSNMTGAVVVDNPDRTQAMNATIDYFDPLGVNVGTVNQVIAAEGHYIEVASALAAVYGVGSARVSANNDGPALTGATLQNTGVFQMPDNAGNVLNFVDGDFLRPGATSFQQLQFDQGTTELWWHFPVSWNAPIDKFTSFNVPWYNVINTSNASNAIQVELIIHDRIAGVSLAPIIWRQVKLLPNGSLTDISGPHLAALAPFSFGAFPMQGLYERIGNILLTNPGIDWDVAVHVTSLSGGSIQGDGYMADLIGPYQNLNGDNAIRMASTMLQNNPDTFVSSPEFSYDLTAPHTGLMQTTICIFNPTNATINSLTYEYHDSFGNIISIFADMTPLMAGMGRRIEPGTFGSPSAGSSGFGWFRIRPCSGKLIGWTVREILNDRDTSTTDYQFHKAYGESLLETNGKEPGSGWKLADGSTRKVAPWVFADQSNWPGYSTFANLSVSNVGRYNWSFWTPTGVNCGTYTGTGVPFGNTSWTYEDPLLTCFGPSLSGRVDHKAGEVEGIDVLGDPPQEWGLEGFGIAPNVVDNTKGILVEWNPDTQTGASMTEKSRVDPASFFDDIINK